jgi:hypothetical protein
MIAEKEGIGSINLGNVHFNDDWNKYKMKFQVNKTLMDRLSKITFHSECIAKLLMDSPMTPLSYMFVRKLRNNEERKVADHMKKDKI